MRLVLRVACTESQWWVGPCVYGGHWLVFACGGGEGDWCNDIFYGDHGLIFACGGGEVDWYNDIYDRLFLRANWI